MSVSLSSEIHADNSLVLKRYSHICSGGLHAVLHTVGGSGIIILRMMSTTEFDSTGPIVGLIHLG